MDSGFKARMVGNDVRNVAHGVNFISDYFKDQHVNRKVGFALKLPKKDFENVKLSKKSQKKNCA